MSFVKLIQLVTMALLIIATYFGIFCDGYQNTAIFILTQKVRCLEVGLTYTGNSLCSLKY